MIFLNEGTFSLTSSVQEVHTSFLEEITCDIVSTKIYDKRDDFDFEIVNFPF